MYRIGAYLRDNEITVSVVKGFESVLNFKATIKEAIYLLETTCEMFNSKITVDVCNVSLIKLFKEFGKLHLLETNKNGFPPVKYGIVYNEKCNMIFNIARSMHSYSADYLTSTRLALPYDDEEKIKELITKQNENMLNDQLRKLRYQMISHLIDIDDKAEMREDGFWTTIISTASYHPVVREFKFSNIEEGRVVVEEEKSVSDYYIRSMEEFTTLLNIIQHTR
jgi:hypothetical protein